MNFFDYLVLALVVMALIWALHRCRASHKQGRGCGGNCAHCTQNCPSKTQHKE